MRSGGTLSVDLDFGTERVELRFMGPHDEYVALLEAARGPGEVTTEEIRELARTKLGSRLAFGYEATIDGLRDRLAARRAGRAPRGRDGASSRACSWSPTGACCCSTSACARSAPGRRRATRSGSSSWSSPTACGSTFGSEAVTFTDVTPSDRRDELAAVLR